jgi:hypothetical protein
MVQALNISTQKQLRIHGQPAFCYLCGGALAGADVDRDHCPPKGFFSSADRINFPIILQTHRPCNNGWKEADEIVGIVADALHERRKSSDLNITRKIDAYSIPFNNKEVAGVTNVPLLPMAKRIVRGMHALLYRDFLPGGIRETMHVPLPATDMTTGRYMQPLDQAFAFGGAIRRAILTNSADTVTAYNGKFRYACVWSHLSNGEPFCIFAFDIYAFHHLSPAVENFPRVFVGSYVPKAIPSTAAWESALKFEITKSEMLDPWRRG